MGIKTIETLPQKGDGICIIRSHGESEDIFEQVKSKGYELIDLTCLDVKKVQSKAMQLANEDYFVIILGKEEHPEVKAICANAQKKAKIKENVFVANNLKSLQEIEEKIKSSKKVGLVLRKRG